MALLHSVADALSHVINRIATVSPDKAIRLVAVSKTKPSEMVMEAYNAGQRHFGENYVKEIVEKAPTLPADIQWHFIGMLQSNKAKTLINGVPNLFMVESVHSIKLANMLNKNWPESKAPLQVLVQINTSGEESKSGCNPDVCTDLVSHVVQNCPRLQFKGLMTIGSPGDEQCFDTLVGCKSKIMEAKIENINLSEEEFELSMGMSGDFETAITKGSTNVRVGSTIFGARSYPPKETSSGDVANATVENTTKENTTEAVDSATNVEDNATDPNPNEEAKK